MSNDTATTLRDQTETPFVPDCRCASFFLSALSLGYDVAIAAVPAGLPPTFRYVANDVCGNAIGLAPAPVDAHGQWVVDGATGELVHRLLSAARAEALGA